jgi:hypothetical protein
MKFSMKSTKNVILDIKKCNIDERLDMKKCIKWLQLAVKKCIFVKKG